jgi:hypothetical protein
MHLLMKFRPLFQVSLVVPCTLFSMAKLLLPWSIASQPMHRPRNLNMEMPSSAGRPSLVAPRPTVRVTPLIIHLVPVVAAIKSSQPASGGWDTGVRSVSLALHAC